MVRQPLRRGRPRRPRPGRADLRWRLCAHLLPTFASYRLDQITVEDVDRYRRANVREGRLSPGSVNKMLGTLSSVLEVAVEYGHIDRNPAAGRRRRLRVSRPPRTYLDRAEHVGALLDAAGALDREGRVTPWRRALLATLTLAGLRIGEALDLRWADVDLAGGRLHVRGTKTDAARRSVRLLPALRDALAEYAARRADHRRDDLLFSTASGHRLDESNVRRRLLAPAVRGANEALARRGCELIPEGLTPHSLRRTFASVLVALGRDPAVVMREMGHATPGFTLSTYAAAMEWGDGERERLRALVEGEALTAGEAASAPSEAVADGR